MLRPLAAVALLAALALAGCSSSPSYNSGSSGDTNGSGTAPSGSGSASAYVKDAPPAGSDFREVHLVFTEVSIHRSAGGNGTTTMGQNATGTATGTSTSVGNATLSASASMSAQPGNESTDEAGWITLFSDSAGVDVDLLNTTGARAAFLGEADLAAGQYQQVRATVASAYGIHQDGSRDNITVSSGTVKVVGGFTIHAGNETRITLDFDLEHSLHRQGNGAWRLTPVVGRTTAAEVDNASSGREHARPGKVQDVPETGS